MEILITGGLGFLGSNLATDLSLMGHNITIIDNLNSLYGGNEFNLHDAKSENIAIVHGDCRDMKTVMSLVKDKELIFHFAAQVSYIDSLLLPFNDLEINALSTLNLLESLRQLKQKSRVIFSSSRMVYGKIVEKPVKESHSTKPLSMYGIHKLLSEHYFDLYYKNFEIPYSIVRITNPYGKKQQMKHNKYSIVGWFIRQAMEKKEIKIFGTGEQRRDYIYISDMVSALKSIAFNKQTSNKIYNLGSGRSIKFKDMVETIVDVTQSGIIKYIDWPKDYERIESGTFEVSIKQLHKDTKWKPIVTFRDGIEQTFEYYKKYKSHYFV